jgi:hypothetical protein
MGWLSGHEPQLRIMSGVVLGANKVGEGSGENEGKIGDICWGYPKIWIESPNTRDREEKVNSFCSVHK